VLLDPATVTRLIRDIPDWPEPGVTFRDITPLVRDHHAFRACVDAFVHHDWGGPIHRVLGIEARGFIFAAPVAYALGAGFVPIRKAGKLPWEIEREEYTLEYGTDLLEVHTDAIEPGERVLIIDDVLATGGTASATVRLAQRLGGDVAGLGFVAEIAPLAGRDHLDELDLVCLVSYH